MNKILFLSTVLFLSFVSCKNNKKKDYSILQSSENIDYSSPEYIKYEFEKLNKKIDAEINSKNEHYTWMGDVTGDSLNGSLFFGPKFTNNIFLIPKLKLTKCNGGYKVEGVICNTSSCDVSNIKIASAVMLNSGNDLMKTIRSSFKFYKEILKSGSTNSFCIKIDISDKSYLTDISDVENITEKKALDSNSSSSSTITQKLKSQEEYCDLGICIEEYVIHYKAFGEKDEIVDKNYLSDTVYNYSSNLWDLFSDGNDLRNENNIENLNPMGDYEFDGLGKKESNFSRKKKEEELNALYQQSIARIKNYANNIGKKFEQVRNPALANGNYEFDQYKTNYDRFKNSPCFQKLGFDPIRALNDSVGLEMEYQNCEKEFKVHRNYKYAFIFSSIILVVLGVVSYRFFSNRNK